MATTFHSKAWAATTVMTTALTVTSVMKYSASLCVITNGYIGVDFIVSALFSTNATLDLECELFDGFETGKFADTAYTAFRVPYANAVSKVRSFQIQDPLPYTKMGIKAASTGQTIKATIRAKPWRLKSV